MFRPPAAARGRATSNASWISITSGASGSGNGSVGFSVTANTGAARTGTLTIAGQTFTVNQARGGARVRTAIAPTSQSVAATAGAGSPVAVSTSSGCTWTATSNASWITITSGDERQRQRLRRVQRRRQHRRRAHAARSPLPARRSRSTRRRRHPRRVHTRSRRRISPSLRRPELEPPVTVSTTGGCTWTASSNASWISITSGASGSGNGTVDVQRRGKHRRRAHRHAHHCWPDVHRQSGGAGHGACAYSITPTSQSVAATGGAGSRVAVSTDSRLRVDRGQQRARGSASRPGRAAAATGRSHSPSPPTPAPRAPARSRLPGRRSRSTRQPASLHVRDHAQPVNRSRRRRRWDSCGGDDQQPVRVDGGEQRRRGSRITSGASGNGNGSCRFSVAANTGAARTGTLTIAGQTFTVNQAAAPCLYVSRLRPRVSRLAAAGGAGGPVAVTDQQRLRVDRGDQRLVDQHHVRGKRQRQRVGRIQRRRQHRRSAQRHAHHRRRNLHGEPGSGVRCTYAITPTSQSVAAAGGTGRPVAVTTNGGCGWTAASNASWISITSGQAATAAGLSDSASPPTPARARSGTLTIAGADLHGQPGSGCPAAMRSRPPVSRSRRQAALEAWRCRPTAGCAWTATSNDSWITITSGASGNGSGSVEFSVTATPGPARNGTLTIAGQTFTVHQAAAAPSCSYTITPTSRHVVGAGRRRNRCVRVDDGRLRVDGHEQRVVDHDHVWSERQRQRLGHI